MIVPEVISTENFPSHRNLVYKYGIKEDVYVPSFKPDPTILNTLGIKKEDIVVTIRPPATEAHYHNPESEKLFFEVVELLVRNPDVHWLYYLEMKKTNSMIRKCKKYLRDKEVYPKNCSLISQVDLSSLDR